ncbi:MAG: PIN domain-containing protein [Candidatus Sigynarchaeota archaeon]
MRVAVDSSVLVGYFIDSDKAHPLGVKLVDSILDGGIEYACVSKITIAETGYVLERKTGDETFAYNCMHAITHDLGFDVLEFTWEFMVNLSHLKAVNPISFCDNATLVAAKLTNSRALFSKEKEIVEKQRSKLQGAGITFIDEFPF